MSDDNLNDTEDFGEDDVLERSFDNNQDEGPVRVKMPKGKQVLGIVTQRLGGGRMRVACMDGKTRICRVPGRLKKSLWVREENVLLIEPWEFGGDEKGDVIYKYRNNQISWLKKSGYLDKINTDDEF